jgi:sugar phosphate permease
MPREQKSHNFHRWVVFAVMSVVYFFVYFHRVSTSVIAPDLLAAFNTHATALGFMSSMYFYLYGLEQPLVGHFSDTIGPRRVVAFWSLIATAGCIIFALAPTIGWAAVGRGFIGFGVGGVYVPAMKAFSQWFHEREFATMTGLLLASGNLGAIVATTPLAWMAKTWGWRASFLLIGAITLGLALTTLFMLRDHEVATEPVSKEGRSAHEQAVIHRSSSIQILASKRFWMVAAIFFGFFGVYLTFQGLWATPFIMSVLKLDALHASGLNMLIPVGFIIGAPLSGWFSLRIFRTRVDMLLFLLVLVTAAWAILSFACPVLTTGGMIALLLVIGVIAGGFGTNLWTLVREMTPSHILGLTSGLLNIFPLLGPAILQIVTGAILDRTGRIDGMYPPTAYRDAFLVCLIIIAGCLALCVILRKQLLRKG